MTYQQRMRQEAFDAEFVFTGMYVGAHKTDAIADMKARAKIKYKGYKTRVVREDGGVSIYVEHRYFADETKRNLEKQIADYETRKANALKRYEAELARLAEEQVEYIEKLKSLNA